MYLLVDFVIKNIKIFTQETAKVFLNNQNFKPVEFEISVFTP